MPTSQLIRLGGLAAVVAGLLRGGASFFPFGEPTDVQELLYLAIDLSILFGLLGIYAYQSRRRGTSGFCRLRSGHRRNRDDYWTRWHARWRSGVCRGRAAHLGGPCTARHRGVAGREAPTIRTGRCG